MKKPIYLSSFCVNFTDYEQLKSFLQDFPDFPLGVEFATYWDLQPDMGDRAEKVLGDFLDNPNTVHSAFYEICNPDGSPEDLRRRELFEQSYRIYEKLGASSMVVHTNEHKFPKKEGQELSIRKILEIYEECRARGIALTVENVGYPHKDNVLFDQEDFIALFDKLPEEIGCLIDTGHAMLNRWDMVKVIKTLGKRIRGYHMNNNDGENDSHYPCFDKRGFYSEEQMEEVIRAAARYSPDADIIVEYAPGPHITKELMQGECRRIMKLWEEENA